MFGLFKKERPVQGLTGMGGGAGGYLVGGSSGFEATGGDVNGQPGGNGYTYHTFTSSGSFVISNAGDTVFEMLVVAGGGGGGSRNSNGSDGGGGGGAGGLIYVPGAPLVDGTYPVTVGAVGAGVPESPGGPVPPSAVGGDSIFKLSGPNAHITAKGGGGGGSGPGGGPMASNGPGGSGGGGGGGGGAGGSYKGDAITQPVTLLAAPLYSAFGNNGGVSDSTSPHVGGSGGGAGAAGTPANQSTGTVGGVGKQYPQFAGPIIGVPALNPQNGYFAGGGAGGAGGPGTVAGASGGLGGGGNSQPTGNNPLSGSPGVSNTGGGGSAGSGHTDGGGGTDGSGRSGGTGIVIIRYLDI